jgi:hypothetical protein
MRHLLRRGRRSLAGWLEPRGAGHHPVPLGMGPVAGMPSRPQPPTGYAGHYCRTARTGARDRAPRRRTRGRPAPAPPARPPSRSPGSAVQPSAHPPSPAAPPPANHRGRQAGCTGMHARLSGSRQAGTRDRRGPSVAVRGKPTVRTDRPGGRTPSAICPWTARHRDLQRDKVTHGGTEKKRPA